MSKKTIKLLLKKSFNPLTSLTGLFFSPSTIEYFLSSLLVLQSKVLVLSFTFILVISFVAIIQISMIYYGGTLFRTSGLTLKEFIIMLLISITVIPFDLVRKLITKKYQIPQNV